MVALDSVVLLGCRETALVVAPPRRLVAPDDVVFVDVVVLRLPQAAAFGKPWKNQHLERIRLPRITVNAPSASLLLLVTTVLVLLSVAFIVCLLIIMIISVSSMTAGIGARTASLSLPW